MNHGTLEEIQTSPKIIDWTIPDFFELPMNIDYTVTSPEFKYLQYTCMLSAKPCGTAEFDEVAIFTLHGIGIDGITQWELEVRRANGSVLGTSYGWKEDGEEAAMDLYISVKEVQSDCKANGFVKVQCKLRSDESIGFQKENDKCLDTVDASRYEKLCCDMEEMMLMGDYFDATIRVQGREFKVHKSVIGVRAAYFVAIHKEEMSKGYTGTLDIDDWDPDAFMEFLRYLYSGRLGKFSHDVILNLYKISDKYQVTELKMYCLQYLVNNMTVDWFCPAMVLSAQLNKEHLIKKCLQFFSDNIAEIRSTEKWQKLESECPTATENFMKRALELQEQKCTKDNFFQKLIIRMKGKK